MKHKRLRRLACVELDEPETAKGLEEIITDRIRHLKGTLSKQRQKVRKLEGKLIKFRRFQYDRGRRIS